MGITATPCDPLPRGRQNVHTLPGALQTAVHAPPTTVCHAANTHTQPQMMGIPILIVVTIFRVAEKESVLCSGICHCCTSEHPKQRCWRAPLPAVTI